MRAAASSCCNHSYSHTILLFVQVVKNVPESPRQAISTVPGSPPGFFTIGLNTFFPDDFIDSHPAFVQALIKMGTIAGEFITLVTEINSHILVAWPHTAIFKEFTLFVPAAMAVFRRKIIKHLFEVSIFFEYRFLQQGFKALGIDVEVAQPFFELGAESSDIAIDMGKTGFAAQATWGNGCFDGVVCHIAPP
jgi:hypothetical protein